MLRMEILRRRSANDDPYLQTFDYTPADTAETVATALNRLNESLEEPVRWDCSCLQKKCGACAMVINGRPGLACNARLADYKSTVRLEPLRKFPVVADLLVDRSVMMDNLRAMQLWLESAAEPHRHGNDLAYEGSRCLQCGCCLEVCPNFLPGDGKFGGMAAAIPASRLLAELSSTELARFAEQYRKHFYAGCGKSLACRDICPAGIDVERLLVNSNAVAVWKRILK